jgi:hypothetical protein
LKTFVLGQAGLIVDPLQSARRAMRRARGKVYEELRSLSCYAIQFGNCQSWRQSMAKHRAVALDNASRLLLDRQHVDFRGARTEFNHSSGLNYRGR